MAKEAKWADVDDVRQRLESATTATGYQQADVEERLLRAEDRIRVHLQGHIGASTLAAWTKDTVPAVVKDWVCALAAAFVLSDFFGQALGERRDGEKAGDWYLNVEEDLKKLAKGTLTIVDTTGADVEPSEDLVESTSSNKTRHFTITHSDDSDAGDGSLDDW